MAAHEDEWEDVNEGGEHQGFGADDYNDVDEEYDEDKFDKEYEEYLKSFKKTSSASKTSDPPVSSVSDQKTNITTTAALAPTNVDPQKKENVKEEEKASESKLFTYDCIITTPERL